jgi:uncharacterized protein YciI
VFIISLTYIVPLATVDEFIEEHRAFLNKYFNSKNIIASGRKVPRNGGVILLHATDLTEVNSIIKADPFYLANIAKYEVIEFIPTLANQDFLVP